QCLDVLRALAKEPATRSALIDELAKAAGQHRSLDAELEKLPAELADVDAIETRSRHVVERLAVALQASLLIRAGNSAVSDTWCRTRLGGQHGQTFGTLPKDAPMKQLIDRAFA